MRKVGFFAGTFDPIHDGHIEVAKAAVEQLGLEQLYFMVEKDPWTEKQAVDVTHRSAMVEIATREIDALSQFTAQQDRFTLTETLLDIENQFPDAELYFVFGADVFMNMNAEQWPSLASLLKHYVVVFERGAFSEKDITDHAKQLRIVTAIIPSMHPHHSSTDVRLKPHQKTIWVPATIAAYIDQHKLYA